MTSYYTTYAKDLISSDTLPPSIGLIVLDGDTLFTMNRTMAEKVAIQYDSLEITTKKFNDCMEVVDSFIIVQNQYKKALEQSELISDMLKKEMDNKDQIIKSYSIIDKNQKELIDGLNNEFRKSRNRNRLLTGLTIGGVTFGVTSFILLLLK